MEFPQSCFVTNSIALVDAVFGSAVSHKVLRTSKHPISLRQFGLQTTHRCSSKFTRKLRVLAKAFVGSSPALVLGGCNTRRECPMHPRPCDFLGSNSRCLFDQTRIAGGAESNVVWE